MTRFLSEALQAPEPFFRQGLHRLEAANGYPATDIRFTAEVRQTGRQKLAELGLDPDDTTPQELYQALQVRVAQDDRRLTRSLRTRAATYISAEADVVAGMVHALQSLPDSRQCYALKPASFRTLMRRLPPKKAMKLLGYRSLDSFLKHETPVTMLSAACLSEDQRWQQRLLDLYKRLQPKDFETRTISVSKADGKRLATLARGAVLQTKHNLLAFTELGAIVLLPFNEHVPDGAVTACLTLALHELNQIRAASTFLKLNQVRSDFGAIVRVVATEEPRLQSQLLDRSVPWHLIQRFYAHHSHHFNDELFEPHIRQEDMGWQPIEAALTAIEPGFAFWQHTAHLGIRKRQHTVSLNLLDAAVNYCNRLPFEARLSGYFRNSLWHELLLRYLHPAAVEQTVLRELQPKLATELALT